MKTQGFTINIHIGGVPTQTVTPTPLPAIKPKPKIAPEVIQKRLDNMNKGKKKALLNNDPYPKVVSTNRSKTTPGLEPKPRVGYYR